MFQYHYRYWTLSHSNTAYCQANSSTHVSWYVAYCRWQKQHDTRALHLPAVAMPLGDCWVEPLSQHASRTICGICTKPMWNYWVPPFPHIYSAKALDSCENAQNLQIRMWYFIDILEVKLRPPNSGGAWLTPPSFHRHTTMKPRALPLSASSETVYSWL